MTEEREFEVDVEEVVRKTFVVSAGSAGSARGRVKALLLEKGNPLDHFRLAREEPGKPKVGGVRERR